MGQPPKFFIHSSSVQSIMLSPRINDLIQRTFASEHQPAASRLIADFSLDNDFGGTERLQIALIKWANGSLEKLVDAIIQGETGWRDLLMAVGFGHDTEVHLAWNLPTPS